ncbi:unnamed protein product [Blepharisma stoltei]|uniref:Uncharacterized protein n=1 Tax=Blepharisma stoltei TaxID=1481888 RepID=A0AAU9IRF4_9CILI|nr:unnamed protein product [Blepharisma stoltei]
MDCFKTYINEQSTDIIETTEIKEADNYRKIEELKQEIKLCNIKNSELESSLKSVKERLIIEKNLVDAKKQKYNELLTNYLETKEMLTKYESKEKEWEDDFQKHSQLLAKSKEDWSKEKNDFEEKIEKFEYEKNFFCEVIQKNEETILNKDEEINNLIEEISSLANQNRIKLSEIEAENKLNKEEKERLLKENQEKTLYLEKTINEMNELVKNIKLLEDSEIKNKAKIQELLLKTDKLYEEFNQLNIKNCQYQLNLNMMQDQLLKMNKEAPDQSLGLSSQAENIKKLEQELNEANEKYELLRQKSIEDCSIIEDMKKQICSFDSKTKFYYENKINFLEENINELIEQCANLEKQLDESKFDEKMIYKNV